jgi:dihydropteroate synthase
MGIVNVTPDSFSDGGLHLRPEDAVEHARRLVAAGAAAVDVGAESTRPGAEPVSAGEEQRRLLPVLRALRPSTDAVISVDTRNASTAAAALELGADAVGDVSLLRHDPDVARVAARAGATLVLCHSRGTPRTMQDAPDHADVVAEVRAELGAAVALAVSLGCRRERIVIDPGLGFGKTFQDNLTLLHGLPALTALGLPVLVGCSRKAFVGALLADAGGPRPVGERVHGSVGAAIAAIARGAACVRVHDVAATVDALVLYLSASSGEPFRRPSCATR